MKKQKAKYADIPTFINEDEEREFWAKNSFLDFPGVFQPVKLDLSRLRPSTQPVTVRLPSSTVSDLRLIANRRDVPYQSLLKIFLAERVEWEMRKSRMKV